MAQFVLTRSGSTAPGNSAGTPSPEAVRQGSPRWRDGRVLVGVVLIVVAMVAGSRLLSGADSRTQVWSFARDLSAGTVVTDDDVVVSAVRIDGGDYLNSDHSPVGSRLSHRVVSGQLVSASSLATEAATDRRLVTVSVDVAHAPSGLSHGERVDVWVTPKDDAASLAGNAAPHLVLAGAVVDEIPTIESVGVASLVPVVLDVPNADVARLVSALHHGDIDLVRLPTTSS